ncbi:MAG: hypothetical protein WCC16_01305, partial [Candidatus Sulfotelmatobacter sp.]
ERSRALLCLHPGGRFWHQSFMPNSARFGTLSPVHFGLGTSPEPMPPPIKEPPNPPESPDAPVREPNPDDPDQI